MVSIRIYEGPELDDCIVADLEVSEVPRIGETIRTTLVLPSSEKAVHRDRYVVRGIEHDFYGRSDAGVLIWGLPTIWVLVEAIHPSAP